MYKYILNYIRVAFVYMHLTDVLCS